MTQQKARVYVPTKTAMQSGRGKADRWHIDFMKDKENYQEPVMGWTGSRSTASQVNLTFETAQEAAAYLDRQGIPYVIEEKPRETIRGKNYSDNFSPRSCS